MASVTTSMLTTRRCRSSVLEPGDVVDDESLHPGAVVWLAEPRLDTDERDQFRDAARHAAMRRHPSARPPRLVVV